LLPGIGGNHQDGRNRAAFKARGALRHRVWRAAESDLAVLENAADGFGREALKRSRSAGSSCPKRPAAADSMWPMAPGVNRSRGLLRVLLGGGWQAGKRDVLPFVGGTFRQKNGGPLKSAGLRQAISLLAFPAARVRRLFDAV